MDQGILERNTKISTKQTNKSSTSFIEIGLPLTNQLLAELLNFHRESAF